MDGLGRALEAISRKTDDLFAVTFGETEIVFRLPPVRVVQQYATLLQLCETDSERNTIYESVFCNVVQDDWLTKNSGAGQLKAGIPESLTKLIIMLSGLDDHHAEYTEELFNAYRNQSNSTLLYMQRTICLVFPGYTFDSLSEINYQKLVNIFIQAEKVLLDRGIIDSEHDFKKAQESKHKPYLVEDAIKADAQAFQEFESPREEDPRRAAHMQKIREAAIRRAKEQELAFKRKRTRR